MDKVFHSSITHHTSLVIPNCDEAGCVFSDASLYGIGGVLCVSRSQCWVPCSFFSRQLLPREQKFAATELEALALLETVEHFKLYLAGRDFVAYTDHQALLGILEGVPSSAKLTDGNTNWKHKLEDYSISIVYIKGEQNPVADALSRQGWIQPLQQLYQQQPHQQQLHQQQPHQQLLHQHISLQKRSLSRIILLLQCLLTKHMLQGRGEVWWIHPPHTHIVQDTVITSDCCSVLGRTNTTPSL